MSAIWCSECGKYVRDAGAGLTCGHSALGVVMSTDSMSGAEGAREAVRLARSGDDLLEGGLPDGLDAEHAGHLRRSGDVLSEDGHNRGQKALGEETWAVLKRVKTQHPLSGFDVAGVLLSIAHDELHATKCRDCGNCVVQDEEDD